MKKNTYISIILLICLIAVCCIVYVFHFSNPSNPTDSPWWELGQRNTNKTQSSGDTNTVQQNQYKNIAYTIDGEKVLLVDGKAEIAAAPGSASKIITSYFGNELRKDLNDDGREDIAFLLTQARGGTGVFYYLVAALTTENGYIGSEAVYLGDRIAPQTTQSGPGRSIIVNYADRLASEPMTSQPTVGKSARFLLDSNTMQFGIVADNFEGEADLQKMSLTMKKWQWQSTTYADGKVVTPKKSGVFSISFLADGTFGIGTDCNNGGGNYSAKNAQITLSQIISTQMYCGGSQESEYVTMLQKAQAYHFTSKGELIIDLKNSGGVMVFR